MLPPLKPIPMKERISLIFIEKAQLDVQEGAFVAIDVCGVRTHLPVGSIACILLEPGTRVSHAAVALAAKVGTLLLWVGEAGVRLYAAGQPGGARSDHLLYQVRLLLDDEARLKIVRKMYSLRFGEEAPMKRSVKQLQSIEGARVKEFYKIMAKRYGLEWKGRKYDPQDWSTGDVLNQCISAANACLYGITEAAILAAGYAPAVGFIHSGKPLSFVYDIADIFKFDTVTPLAFKIAAKSLPQPEREVRWACRDVFRSRKILEKIIPSIEEILAVGGLEKPQAHKEVIPIAIPNPENIGDVGHRS